MENSPEPRYEEESKDNITPEVREALERNPIRLGEHGGVILSESYIASEKEELARTGAALDIDPNYEYIRTDLYFKDRDKYEDEGQRTLRLVNSSVAWPLTQWRFDRMRGLSSEEQQKIFLTFLCSGETLHDSILAFSPSTAESRTDAGLPLTDDDFADPLTKRLAKYLIFETFQGLDPRSEEFFESLSDTERVELLNFMFKKLLKSGHERSTRMLLWNKEHNQPRLLADDRFNYLIDRIDKTNVEILWARDVCDIDLGRHNPHIPQDIARAKSVAEKLGIDPKAVLEKASMDNNSNALRENILTAYPELA